MRFNSTYRIFDVREIDGHRLLLLRWSGGGTEQWRGDWSASSLLWTQRLLHKLQYSAVDCKYFWMNVDDFCNAFRVVYVCKCFNQNKWFSSTLDGSWRKSNTYEPMKNSNKHFNALSAKTSFLSFNSAGGLPSSLNRNCEVWNNPFYSLQLFSETEIHLSLIQVDANGKASTNIWAAGLYILHGSNVEQGNRPRHITKENLIASSGSAKAIRVVHLNALLPAGKYFLLAALLQPNKEGTFQLRIASDRLIETAKVWPPLAGAPVHSLDSYENDIKDSL